MKTFFILKIFTFPVLLCSGLMNAQSAIVATGGNMQSTGGSIAFSTGQVADKSIASPTGNVTQGVQQPYEILTLATDETAKSKDILLYPNPVKDVLFVDFNNSEYKNTSFELYDSQGKLIQSEKISSKKSEINFSTYPSSLYILKVSEQGKALKTFKIIKK